MNRANSLIIIFVLFFSNHFAQIADDIDVKYSCGHHLEFESDNCDSLIVYKGFVIKYNYTYRVATFAYSKITPEQISPSSGLKAKRRSSFFVDPRIVQYSSTNKDFKNSGYDRGHLVPAGDFYSNKALKDETFVLSNICPQNPVLNRGIWAGLEERIRQKILGSNHEAFIVTGTICSEFSPTIGLNQIKVPSYLYKIIFIPASNEMYAFLFNNLISSYLDTINFYQVRVDDIENITDNDFFEKLPDTLEKEIESIILPFK